MRLAQGHVVGKWSSLIDIANCNGFLNCGVIYTYIFYFRNLPS